MQFTNTISLIVLFLSAAAVTSAPVETEDKINTIAAISSFTSREAPVLLQANEELIPRGDNNNNNSNGGDCTNKNKNCSSNKNTCNSNQNACSRSDDRMNTNCCCV